MFKHYHMTISLGPHHLNDVNKLCDRDPYGPSDWTVEENHH